MKYLSLFSGIGGFELGLKNSIYDFECVGFSEIDKWAKSIYLKHFPRHNDLGDATEIKAEELPEFDLLVGGFPCQAFSLSGKRKGFDDTRGTLFFEIARICAEKKPRYLLLENVKGLLSHDGGRTYKKMLGVLSELGYDVEWQVYNSKSYGVPQNRERLYIKGYFRAKCGGEILSAKRGCREVNIQMNTLIPNHQATRIMDIDGVSCTLVSLGGGMGAKTGLYKVPKVKSHKFNRQVKKRVNDVDYKELSLFLKDAKENAKISVREISEKLGKPQSEVGHWFRTDDFFTPPSDDVWLQLKQLLGIESNKYDKFMLEFEWVDGVFEQDKRACDVNGISSTLTTRESLIVDPNANDPKVEVIGNIGNTGHNGENVLSKDGVSSTITATNYKHPVKIIETDFETDDERKIIRVGNTNGYQSGEIYSADGISPTLCGFDKAKSITKIKEESYKPKIVDNVYENGHWSGNVYDQNHIAPTMMGQRSDNVVRIREDLEVEKVYDSTQKHRAETDGESSPTLTSAMGMGGGHVPMLKLKTNTEKGYDEVTDGDGVRLCHPSSTKARGRTQKGQTGALSTGSDWGTVDRDYRIRRLTPRECERLQAFPDDFTRWGKDGEEISDTQRYKCLGNAVTTTVITHIANNMFGGYFEDKRTD